MDFYVLKNATRILSLIMDDLTSAYHMIDRRDFIQILVNRSDGGYSTSQIPDNDELIDQVIIRINSPTNIVHSGDLMRDPTFPKWWLDIIFFKNNHFGIKMISRIMKHGIVCDINEVSWHIGCENHILASFKEMCPIYPTFNKSLENWYESNNIKPDKRKYPDVFILNSSEENEEQSADVAIETDNAHSKPGIKAVDAIDTPRYDSVSKMSEAVKILGEYIPHIETEKGNSEGVYTLYSINNNTGVCVALKNNNNNQHNITIYFHSDLIVMDLYEGIDDRMPGTSEKERVLVTSSVKPDDVDTFKRILKFMISILSNTAIEVSDITF